MITAIAVPRFSARTTKIPERWRQCAFRKSSPMAREPDPDYRRARRLLRRLLRYPPRPFATAAFAARTAESSLDPLRSMLLATWLHWRLSLADFAFRVWRVASADVHGMASSGF